MNDNRVVLLLVNHDIVIYNFRFEIVERLIQEGYEVHISSPKGEHTQELIDAGAFFHEISIKRHGMNPIEELGLLGKYKRLISEIKPIIVFTFTIKCNIYGGMASRSLHIPFVANVTGLGTMVNEGGWKEKMIIILYRIGLNRAQRVFFQNTANKNYFISKHVINSSYSVLPGSGVNLEKHCYELYPDERGGLVFSTIGRLMRDKGTDELIEAARKIKSKYPETTFRLIGFFDDKYETKVKKAVEEGIIQYITQQRDIHPWISSSHAIIHPSHHEGMSNVLLEAAATGRPVIATDISGCRETFEDGISGISFMPGDYRSLVNAVERFILLSRSDREKMGKAGRKKVEKEFDRNIVVNRYMLELDRINEK